MRSFSYSEAAEQDEPGAQLPDPGQVSWVVALRRRAWQAEAEAHKAQNDISRAVFVAVAEAWHSIALEAARRHRRQIRAHRKGPA